MAFENSVGLCVDDIPESIQTLFSRQTPRDDKPNDSHFREKAFALNYVSDAVIQYNRNMKVIWANKAACNLAESSFKDLQQYTRCQNILDCCPAECSQCPVKTAFQKGQQCTAEIQTKDRRKLSLTAIPFMDSNGNVDYVIEIITDITSHVVVENILSYDYSDVIAFSHRLALLTGREHEVMTLVVRGKSNNNISDELHVSPKTVEIHRSRVMKKLKVNSLAELVQLSTLFDFYHQCMLQ